MSDDPNYNRLKPEDRLGDAPIEAKWREQMMAIAQAIDELFNAKFFEGKEKDRQTGFILLLFPFGESSGRCNYISNGANREDVVTLMKEMIARFEGQPELKGTA